MAGPKKGRRVTLISGAALVVVLVVIGGVNREHFRFFLEFESLGLNAHGYPEYQHRQTGIVFVKLPGGRFLMGSSKDEEGRDDIEGPRHEVELSPFLISKHEVTQAEWRQVMGMEPSHFKEEDLPMQAVTWYESQEFCRRTGLRLPTEAEWEYACRAGSGAAFCFGDDATLLGEYAWYRENSVEETHPVGRKHPNPFGLHDMHGNVFEWCEDMFDREFYSKPEATMKNPVCNSGSGFRVLRGGCWWDDAGHCRSALRVGTHPDWENIDFSFRPAKSLP